MVCPVCGSFNIKENASVVNKVWKSNYPVNFCQNCELWYLSQNPSKEEIKTYYDQNYFIYHPLVEKVKNIFRDFRCKSQYNYIKQKLEYKKIHSVLEIGAADGKVLNLFKKNDNLEVYGIDYNSSMRKKAWEKYRIIIEEKALFYLSGKYDLIILSHVFEHVIDIDQSIEKIKELLTEKGLCFMEMPNSPIFGINDQEEIDTFWNTAHIYNFTPKNIKFFLKKHSLEILSIDRYYYCYPKNYSIQKKKNLSNIFMSGNGLKLKYLLPIMRYFLNSFILQKNSYQKFPLDTQWLGKGDNIRFIIKK